MSTLRCASVIACLISVSALHGQSPAPADSLSTLLLRLIRERGAAAQRADTAAYRRLVDPAMIYIDDDGSRQSAEQHIPEIGAKGPVDERIRQVSVDSLHVYVAGDMAMVDYWSVESLVRGSGAIKTPGRSLETFVRWNGRWLLLRHAETDALTLPPPVALNASALDEYVGRYEWWPGYVDTITRVGNQLFDQSTGEKKATLNLAATPEAFYIDGDPGLVVFVRDKTGKVVGYVVLWRGGRVTRARKLP